MNSTIKTMPVINVDPTAMKKAHNVADEATCSGEMLACKARLASFKMLTVNGSKLRGDDLGNACRLVRKMNRKGWLTEADIKWCADNGITL